MKSKITVLGTIMLIAVAGLVFYLKDDRSAKDAAKKEAFVAEKTNLPEYQQPVSKTIEDTPPIMETKVIGEATQQIGQSTLENQEDEIETRQTGVSELAEQEIESLIRKLDSENNDERNYSRIDLILMGESIIPMLVETYKNIDGDSMQKIQIYRILGELESNALEDIVINELNQFDELKKGFYQLQYLEVINSEKRLPFIERIINAESPHKYLLMIALRSSIKENNSFDYDRFLNHPDLYIQGVTLLYMALEGQEIDGKKVEEIARSRSTSVKTEGIRVLGEIADERSKNILEELLNDPTIYHPMKVRIKQALAKIEIRNTDDELKVERLKTIRTEYPKITGLVIDELSRIDTEESTKALKAMLFYNMTADYRLIKVLIDRGYAFKRDGGAYVLQEKI